MSKNASHTYHSGVSSISPLFLIFPISGEKLLIFEYLVAKLKVYDDMRMQMSRMILKQRES